eukprot:TRINITY_DN6014_c0_g1_i1.p1 TRINITY_DN6014_c0_g1~~TRINITY_DN6014_c0_g1_i1.p1  ORF type:complete len:1217 (+),score=18.84 TRINITY_DN6014_c0_g1_i1:84-3734(+)
MRFAVLVLYTAAVSGATISQYTYDGGRLTDSTTRNDKGGKWTVPATVVCPASGDAATMTPGRFMDIKNAVGLPGGNSPFAVAMDVLPVTVGDRTLFSFGADGANEGFELYVADGSIGASPTARPATADGPALAVGVWQNIVVTYDGMTMSIVVNGVVAHSAVHAALSLSPSGDLTVGSDVSKLNTEGEYYVDNVYLADAVPADLNDLRACNLTPSPATPHPPTPAPPTLSPSSLSPPTPSPPTPAPLTLQPPTPSPPTPAPLTLQPPTPSPPTPAPLTLQPPTPSPATAAPQTSAPSTPAPPTPAPRTPSPPSSWAPTIAPPTQVPVTPSPAAPSTPTLEPPSPGPPTPLAATLSPPTPTPDTQAPFTPSPPTPAHLTIQPPLAATPAPPTPTSSPATLTPLTPPATATPLTPSPATPFPPSSLPAVDPSTLVPPTPSPRGVEVLESAEVQAVFQHASVAGDFAAVGALAGGSAGTAMAAIVSAKLCGAKSDSLALHPSQIEVMGSESAGMVIGNTLIAVGFSALCAAAVIVARVGGRVLFPDLFEGMDSQGLLRFPSAPLLVAQMLYQGTTLGAMSLCWYGGTPGLVCLGVVSAVACLVGPIILFKKIRGGVPRRAVYAPVASRRESRLMTFLLGPGEWCSKDQLHHWVLRYVTVLRPYREVTAWFGSVEMIAYLAVSGIQALVPVTYVACGHQKLGCAVIFALLVILRRVLSPLQRPRDYVVLQTAHTLQIVALVLMAVGYYTEDTNYYGFAIAGDIMLVCTALLLIKVAADAITELYVLCSGSRKRIQTRIFELYSSSIECAIHTQQALRHKRLGVVDDVPLRRGSKNSPAMDKLASGDAAGYEVGVVEEAESEAELPLPQAGPLAMLGKFMSKRRREQTADVRSGEARRPQRARRQDDASLLAASESFLSIDHTVASMPSGSHLHPRMCDSVVDHSSTAMSDRAISTVDRSMTCALIPAQRSTSSTRRLGIGRGSPLVRSLSSQTTMLPENRSSRSMSRSPSSPPPQALGGGGGGVGYPKRPRRSIRKSSTAMSEDGMLRHAQSTSTAQSTPPQFLLDESGVVHRSVSDVSEGATTQPALTPHALDMSTTFFDSPTSSVENNNKHPLTRKCTMRATPSASPLRRAHSVRPSQSPSPEPAKLSLSTTAFPERPLRRAARAQTLAAFTLDPLDDVELMPSRMTRAQKVRTAAQGKGQRRSPSGTPPSRKASVLM